MITLTIEADFLFQIHKNHLKEKVAGNFVLRFTSVTNKSVIEVTSYSLQEYYNFYLFTINTLDFGKLDTSAELTIISPSKEVVYKSDINLK
jgi:hypothetical protein